MARFLSANDRTKEIVQGEVGMHGGGEAHLGGNRRKDQMFLFKGPLGSVVGG